MMHLLLYNSCTVTRRESKIVYLEALKVENIWAEQSNALFSSLGIETYKRLMQNIC